MIANTKRLARQLWAVFTRARRPAPKVDSGPWVKFVAGSDGLDIRTSSPEAAIGFHMVGRYEPAVFTVPLSLLAECEGRPDDPVRVEIESAGTVLISWIDSGVPRQHHVRPCIEEKPGGVSARPERIVNNPAGGARRTARGRRSD